MSKLQPSGVITITTDFGHQGPFVGVMKGCILSRFPAARIVDLTHEIVVHWPAEAGFWLARAYRYFPAGTVHIAVVDPGVGTSRDIIVVSAGGHLFFAPDNGLLAPIVAQHAGAAAGQPGDGACHGLGVNKSLALGQLEEECFLFLGGCSNQLVGQLPRIRGFRRWSRGQ